MKNRKLGTIGLVAMMTAQLCLSSGVALAAKQGAPMTPELAAKRENYRKQHEQRITHEKRKVAVDSLKAERIKVYKAKQARNLKAPAATDTK
jgi:6-phosphogluconolactonase (cycloisomerase 2 family)